MILYPAIWGDPFHKCVIIDHTRNPVQNVFHASDYAHKTTRSPFSR